MALPQLHRSHLAPTGAAEITLPHLRLDAGAATQRHYHSPNDDPGGVQLITLHISTTPNPTACDPDNPTTTDPPSSSLSNSPPITRPVTALYTVVKPFLVRVGPSAVVEPPAVRVEALGTYLSARRARDVARRVWRQNFAGGVPEGRTAVFDGVEVEDCFAVPRSRAWEAGREGGDGEGGGMGIRGGVEVWRAMNRGFMCEKDGVEVLEGERRVGVWRAGVDCAEGWDAEVGDADGEEGDGGRTPDSEWELHGMAGAGRGGHERQRQEGFRGRTPCSRGGNVDVLATQCDVSD